MQVRADRPAENRDALDEPPHATRRRDADRVGKDELVGRVEPLAQVRDGRRVDLALEGAAPRARDGDGRRHTRCGKDRLHARDRFVERGVRVALVERLGRGERAVHAGERRPGEPLVAALVQHEARQLGVAALRRRDHILGARHLRDAIVAHERDRLDARHTCRSQARDELGANSRRERLGLVLEPVARPDVADRHVHPP